MHPHGTTRGMATTASDASCRAQILFFGVCTPPKEQKPSAANRSANGFASSPPRHVWAVESAATERIDDRLVKRVVLLRLFYGSEMQKCDVARLQHQPLFFFT
jgi:hypothetical protein